MDGEEAGGSGASGLQVEREHTFQLEDGARVTLVTLEVCHAAKHVHRRALTTS